MAEEISEDPSQQLNKKKQIASIRVICVIGFIGSGLLLPRVFLDASTQIGTWYPPYLGFSAIIGLVCIGGIWNMQRWAVYTYASLFVINEIVFLLTGTWNILSLIIPLIVIIVAALHLKEMDKTTI